MHGPTGALYAYWNFLLEAERWRTAVEALGLSKERDLQCSVFSHQSTAEVKSTSSQPLATRNPAQNNHNTIGNQATMHSAVSQSVSYGGGRWCAVVCGGERWAAVMGGRVQGAVMCGGVRCGELHRLILIAGGASPSLVASLFARQRIFLLSSTWAEVRDWSFHLMPASRTVPKLSWTIVGTCARNVPFVNRSSGGEGDWKANSPPSEKMFAVARA